MSNFHSFIIYVFIATFTPGPNNIMSMSNVVRYGGLKNSYPFNLGVFAGFFLVMCAGAVFSSALYDDNPQVRVYMLSAGAAYMLYLAWKIFRSGSDISAGSRAREKASFVTGVLLQFINVKLFIYAVTTMSVYIIPAYGYGAVLAGFSAALAFVGLLSTLVWALFGEIFHKLLREHSRIVNSVMALLLIYCAVSLFL